MKDGDGPPYYDELTGPRRMDTTRDGMTRRGLAEDDIEKMMGLRLTNYTRPGRGLVTIGDG